VKIRSTMIFAHAAKIAVIAILIMGHASIKALASCHLPQLHEPENRLNAWAMKRQAQTMHVCLAWSPTKCGYVRTNSNRDRSLASGGGDDLGIVAQGVLQLCWR
jgi:hypothetical protein